MDAFIEARSLDRSRMSVTLQRGNAIHDLEFDFANNGSPSTPFPVDEPGTIS
jgi:hypothetical protein